MEVNAALFLCALEANDLQVSRKVFVDMDVLLGWMCAPWCNRLSQFHPLMMYLYRFSLSRFSMLFIGSLPPKYLNRVWDIFLFKGGVLVCSFIPLWSLINEHHLGILFLLCVMLILANSGFLNLLRSTSEESLLVLLPHHPFNCSCLQCLRYFSLPLFFVKLKDDDVWKQHIKMEAQVKRQTQVPHEALSSTMSSMILLPRSWAIYLYLISAPFFFCTNACEPTPCIS